MIQYKASLSNDDAYDATAYSFDSLQQFILQHGSSCGSSYYFPSPKSMLLGDGFFPASGKGIWLSYTRGGHRGTSL